MEELSSDMPRKKKHQSRQVPAQAQAPVQARPAHLAQRPSVPVQAPVHLLAHHQARLLAQVHQGKNR